MERADGDHGNSAVVQVFNGFFLKAVVAGINQAVVEFLIRIVALARFFFLGEDRFQCLRIAFPPGIQQNRLKLTRPEWYVFTIRVDGNRVGLKRMQEICKTLELEMVPVEEVGTDLPAKYPTVEALVERADGNYPNGGKKEGIVIRPTEPIYCERISTDLSMKVVSNKYLLKNEG